MDKIVVEGGVPLRGSVEVSGAKNAALPIIAAALLAEGDHAIGNVPDLADVRTLARLLGHMGCGVERNAGLRTAQVRVPRQVNPEAPYELVKTMRASVVVLGPLVARWGRARVSLPGGCAIGARPIDQHLKGLAALGAEIRLDHGYVEAFAPKGRLRGAVFTFDGQTVTGTENVMMAATLARGTTVLENCAREPEVGDLARLLGTLGARIEGAGSDSIRIEGVDSLGGGRHRVIPDRIEGGTYLIGGALTGGDVTLTGTHPDELTPLLEVLAGCGAEISSGDGWVRVTREGELEARDVVTAPYPGFPTDLQAQYVALMTQAHGVATVIETVFENRMQHVAELARMGADIRLDGSTARIHGPARLSGATVMATDLRASACLVLAGLVAEGETVIDRIYHLDRGYEAMESRLVALGARVERVRRSD
jgi:UDP-N-acetylglucosamine 1-carboxyvinyltransferase